MPQESIKRQRILHVLIGRQFYLKLERFKDRFVIYKDYFPRNEEADSTFDILIQRA